MAGRQIDIPFGRLTLGLDFEDDPPRDEGGAAATVVIESSDDELPNGFGGGPLPAPSSVSEAPAALPDGEVAMEIVPVRGKAGVRLPPRSAATAANARAHRVLAATKAKAALAEKKASHLQQVLGGVVALLPGASKLVGKANTTAVGRLPKGSLKPAHFMYLCRAAFMPAKTSLQVGITMKRLLAAATSAVKHRQEAGLKRLLQASAAALTIAPEGDGRMVHLSYSHLWDEVNCKFVWNAHSQFRQGRSGVHVQTIVQRGGITCTLASERHNAARSFREAWLLQPQKVFGTSAEAMWPAIRGGLPKAFDLMDTNKMETLCSLVSSFTFQFVCDKASGNLSMMKKVGLFYHQELLPKSGGKLLLWVETCSVHLLHRCKLQVKALRDHTMRHFSLANLVRLASLRSQMLVWLEAQVPGMVIRRTVGPRPRDLPGNLAVFIEVLYKLSHPHHDRKRGRKSMRHADLTFLMQMLNGNVRGEWEHFCFDAASGHACCQNMEECKEKTTRAVINFFQAEAEPIPAESRWTHTLPNFKKTLMRKAIYGVGVRCFLAGAAGGRGENLAEGLAQDIDGQAAEDHTANLNKARLSKCSSYFRSPTTFPELAALTLVLDVVDTHGLYPLLGDPILNDEDGRPSKIDVLLDPDNSALGKCSEGLLKLLDSWMVGGEARDPWCVLDMVGGDPRDQYTKQFSRSQILRMNSSFSRRYLTRYGTWPYLLYPLCCAKFSDEAKRRTAEHLLRAPTGELDVYSSGIRRLFDTVDKLLSLHCRETLAADFRSQALSTDVIERLNAEISATTPRRAPARSFANASRESFLRQVAVVHKFNGGNDPLGGSALTKAALKETVRTNPLLRLDDARVGLAHQGPGAHPLELLDREEPLVLAPAAVVVVEGPALGAAAGSHGEIVPQGSFFGEALVISRDASSCLPALDVTEKGGQRRGAGLSPYMLELNKTMAAARASKGSSLTDEEMQRVRSEFRIKWAAMGDHGVFKEAFDIWRAAPKMTTKEEEPERPYKLMWGGGCPSTPLTTEEFWAWHQQFGWPSDADVFNEMGAEVLVHPDKEQIFDTNFKLWGIGRAARNIDRATVPSQMQFNLVETGMLNFIESLTKPVADAGNVLFIIEGRALCGEGQTRCAALLTGTCYAPKVFDVTPCESKDGARFFPADAAIPFLVKISSEPCRAVARYPSIGFETSDEFILALVTNFSTMSLYTAQYEIPDSDDGTLRWSLVHSLELIGMLWEPGLRRPLLADQVRMRRGDLEAILKRMRTGNPLQGRGRPAALAPRQQQQQRQRGRGVPQADAGVRHELVPALAPHADPAEDAVPEPEHTNTDGDILMAGVGDLAPLGWGDEMDIAEAEDADGAGSDLDELCPTYGIASQADGSCLGRVGGVGDDLEDGVPLLEEDAIVAAVVAKGLVDGAADVALEEPTEGSGASSSSVGPVGDGIVAGQPPRPAPLPQPWEEVSDPGSSGYMYYEGRSIARVQYGKPQKSVTINCYRHPNCKLLVAESRCPDVVAIKKWLFDTEVPLPDASSQAKKELAKLHMAHGRAAWFANRTG